MRMYSWPELVAMEFTLFNGRVTAVTWSGTKTSNIQSNLTPLYSSYDKNRCDIMALPNYPTDLFQLI